MILSITKRTLDNSDRNQYNFTYLKQSWNNILRKVGDSYCKYSGTLSNTLQPLCSLLTLETKTTPSCSEPHQLWTSREFQADNINALFKTWHKYPKISFCKALSNYQPININSAAKLKIKLKVIWRISKVHCNLLV